MHMDLFNVVEKGTSRVYRLTFAEEGLYMIYLANIEGQNDYAGGAAELRTNKQEAREYMERLTRGEEELSEQMTRDALDHEYSRSFNWGAIKSAAVGADDHELRLETDSGAVELDLRNNPPDRIETFINLVRRTVDEEQAGRRELRRQ